MGANETRLLVLATVSLLQPANGYQVRRELIAWGVDRWAHIQPGSIYGALATLAKHGSLEEVAAQDQREVTHYRVTAAGRTELQRLMEQAITTVDPARPLAFFTAINLCGLTTRARYVELLRHRLAVHEEWARTVVPRRSPELPEYVQRAIAYRDATIRAEMTWLRETIPLLEAGAQQFADDERPWLPRIGDEALDQAPDPQRYRRALGIDPALPGDELD